MGDGQLSTMVEELNNKFIDAFKTRDFAAVAGMFTDDAVMLPPRRNIVTGRGNIESFWSQAARIKELKFDSASVTAIGSDVAREIGTLRMRVEPGRRRRVSQGEGETGSANAGPQSREIAGKYVFVWRKIDGQWKLETSIWNVSTQREGRGRAKRRRARESRE
jgi:uncharacterized protein (TIGR02246 family)